MSDNVSKKSDNKPVNTKNRKIFLIVALTVLILVGGGIVSAVVINQNEQREYKTVTETFNTTTAELDEANSSLTDKIKEAEEVLSTTTAENVTDTGALDKLKELMENAKSINADKPEMAQKSDGVKSQIDKLNATKIEIDKAIAGLTTQTEVVNKNKVDKTAEIEKQKAEEEAKNWVAIEEWGVKFKRPTPNTTYKANGNELIVHGPTPQCPANTTLSYGLKRYTNASSAPEYEGFIKQVGGYYYYVWFGGGPTGIDACDKATGQLGAEFDSLEAK